MKKTLILSILFLLAKASSYAQCAMCSATVESNDESLVGTGLNSGIMFLMAIPYILIGTIAFFWYRSYKKHQKSDN